MEKFTLSDRFTDEGSERGLVLALCKNPALVAKVAGLLKPEAFAYDAARQAFVRLLKGEHVEPPFAGVPAQDVEQTAKELAELYRRREMARTLEAALEALEGQEPARDILTKLHQKLARTQAVLAGHDAPLMQSLDELEHVVREDLERRKEAVASGKPVGIDTGLGALDALTGGLQAGVHVLAGEPGAGKTTLALQFAVTAAASRYPALFVSFEESAKRLALRAVACWYNLKYWPDDRIVPKVYEEGRGDLGVLLGAFAGARDALRAFKIIQGHGRLDVSQVEGLAHLAMEIAGADRCLVVVDYLQRWASLRGGEREFRHAVSGLVGELRALALSLESPVLVISSQNRPGQGEARLTSLKESGDIEYTADTALFLVKDEKNQAIPPQRNVTLKLEKNRFGETDQKVLLSYYPDLSFFKRRIEL
jgi:replicative DNA helicase